MLFPRVCLSCLLLLLASRGAWAQTAPAPITVVEVRAQRIVVKAHPRARHRHIVHHVARRLPDCGARGPTTAYSPASGVAFEGRIDSVVFRPDRTILIVGDRTGETCAFLPARADLEKHGLPPMLLQRRTSVAIEGFADRSDKRKVLVQQLVAHPRS